MKALNQLVRQAITLTFSKPSVAGRGGQSALHPRDSGQFWIFLASPSRIAGDRPREAGKTFAESIRVVPIVHSSRIWPFICNTQWRLVPIAQVDPDHQEPPFASFMTAAFGTEFCQVAMQAVGFKIARGRRNRYAWRCNPRRSRLITDFANVLLPNLISPPPRTRATAVPLSE